MLQSQYDEKEGFIGYRLGNLWYFISGILTLVEDMPLLWSFVMFTTVPPDTLPIRGNFQDSWQVGP